jgi:hypothetical protein
MLRWLAVAIVLYLVWKATSRRENMKPETGVYDAQFFAEQDSQRRENPMVGILQEDVFKNKGGRTGSFVPAEPMSGLPMYAVT